ncbi:unnamed protein product, partial [Strongylus vulgaris]
MPQENKTKNMESWLELSIFFIVHTLEHGKQNVGLVEIGFYRIGFVACPGHPMVSLNKLMSVDEHGVNFESPHTAEQMSLPPEMSIEIQQALGADIMMQLDHVIHVLTTGDIVEEAMQRSIRWLDRCEKAHTRSDQALFPIVQGGLDLELRKKCVEEMAKRAK